MAEDIVPDLLASIKKEFYSKVKEDEKLKNLLELLNSGKATYTEANTLAIRVGTLLSESLKENISVEILPDGKMYFNIAKRILNGGLSASHELVADFAVDVQKELNKKAGISAKALRPEFNQDRADGLIDKVSNKPLFSDAEWVIDRQVIENFNQSIVNDTVKKNADFHNKLGLKPKIVRTTRGHCCDYCQKLAGTYDYPNVPKEIFSRHRSCDCDVSYIPDGKRKQNVWSKEWR